MHARHLILLYLLHVTNALSAAVVSAAAVSSAVNLLSIAGCSNAASNYLPAGLDGSCEVQVSKAALLYSYVCFCSRAAVVYT
jgi:hypothetical protein